MGPRNARKVCARVRTVCGGGGEPDVYAFWAVQAAVCASAVTGGCGMAAIVPRSLGLMFEPPTITLVYSVEGTLRKRTIPVRRLKPSSEAMSPSCAAPPAVRVPS